MSEKRISLFSNGFEWECWDEKNCSRCVKVTDDGETSDCDLFNAITEAMCNGGWFEPEIVARFQWKPEYRAVLGWPCPELQTEPSGPPSAADEMRKAGAVGLFDTPAPAAAAPLAGYDGSGM